jgi:hypothetical protein
LPSIQDIIYPRIKSNLTEQDLKGAYTPQRQEMEWAEKKSRRNFQQLALMVLLKTVQKVGFFMNVLDIPQTIIEHIVQETCLLTPQPEEWKMYSGSITWKRHHRFVLDYLQIHPLNDQARTIMVDMMSKLS